MIGEGSAPASALECYLGVLLDPGPHGGSAPEAAPDAAGAGVPDAHREWREVCALQLPGLRLCLPQGRVERVLETGDMLQPLPLPAPFRGVLEVEGRRALGVDLWRLVQGSRPDPAPPIDARRAVLVGAGRWALLCVEVESLWLDPAQVHWHRPGLGRRPWLAGTARSLRCGLVDADALVGWLWRRLRSHGTADASPGTGDDRRPIP